MAGALGSARLQYRHEVVTVRNWPEDIEISTFSGEDWQRQWQQTQKETLRPAPAKTKQVEQPAAQKKKSKLTYQEQLDLKALPAKIEELEARQQAFNDQMSDPGFYQQDAARITEIQQQVAALEAELAAAFERWETLEAKQDG